MFVRVATDCVVHIITIRTHICSPRNLFNSNHHHSIFTAHPSNRPLRLHYRHHYTSLYLLLHIICMYVYNPKTNDPFYSRTLLFYRIPKNGLIILLLLLCILDYTNYISTDCIVVVVVPLSSQMVMQIRGRIFGDLQQSSPSSTTTAEVEAEL